MDDAREAVISALTGSGKEPRSVRQGAGGWTATTGGHVPARAESIRFVKERQAGDVAMLAFEYEDVEDREWHGWLGVERKAGGWRTVGGASGSGHDGSRTLEPWANLGCAWSDRLMMAGGRVHGDGVARVRLLSAGGGAAEDSVDDGIALLIATGPFPRPWTAELYDAAGTLLGSHPYPRRPT